MGPQLYRCGNNTYGVTTVAAFQASMGPQLYRCGNGQDVPVNGPGERRCFNGAATLSLRKLDILRQHRPRDIWLQWGRNFIVAETSHSGHCRPYQPMLQWGRNFIVAETQYNEITLYLGGLLQWGRNFIVAETTQSHILDPHLLQCFNGAATLSLRKLVTSHCH